MDIVGMTGHIIICGWNSNGTRLIKDLESSSPQVDIVVLSERDDIPRIIDDRVHYVKDDPTTEQGLTKAQLRGADVVVVLSDRGEGRTAQDADARAILTVLAVERRNPRVHSIVELVHEENLFHVQNAGVDEIIISEAYTGTMMSQSVQNPGLSDAFRDLFEAGTGSAMRSQPVPDDLVGTSFDAAAVELRHRKDGILIGYRRGEEVELAPEDDITFELGDEVILLAPAVSD